LNQIVERCNKIIVEFKNSQGFIFSNEIGNLYRKHNSAQDSLKFYYQALDIYKAINKSEIDPELLYAVYCNIASASYAAQRYGDSLQYYRDAEKYYVNLSGGINKQNAQININIGKVYKAMNKTIEGKCYIKKAFEILAKLEKKGINVDQVRKDFENYALSQVH